MFLRRAEGDAWPDFSDEALAADPGWLAPFLTGQDEARRDRRRRSRERPRRGAALGPVAAPRRRSADPFPGADAGPRRRSTTKPKAARRSRCASRSCSASTSIRRLPAGAFRSPSICSRPPTVRSRSRATCQAFGAAPGPPCAPTFAAAIPAISGPRIPPPLRRPRERSREERERAHLTAAIAQP